MQKGFVAKMAPVGKLFDKVRLPEIARESGCHYVELYGQQASLVEKVICNAVHIAQNGLTYLQLHTPCILKSARQYGRASGNAGLGEGPSGLRTRSTSASPRSSCWPSLPRRTRNGKRRQSNWPDKPNKPEAIMIKND